MIIRKKDYCFDYIVVGAGLSGLVVTAGLKQKGFDVLLLDGADFAGGSSRTVFTPVGLSDNGLKIIPYHEELNTENACNYDELVKHLSEILGENVAYEIIENGPITFAHKEMRPFVGFGSSAPEFHKPLSYYLTNKRINFLICGKVISIGDLTARLIAIVGSSFVPRSMVTQFVQDEKAKITHVTVNGTKNIAGLKFVYCGSPKSFASLLPAANIPLKFRQKCAKGFYWTTICSDFFHKGSITEAREMHVLNGTTQDELGPCVGIFHSLVTSKDKPEEQIQHSQWLTFLDDESTSDAEAMGAILKKIKKQIKRAYPHAFDHLISERIAVTPFNESELDLKVAEIGLLPGFVNLFAGSGDWSGSSNILGNFIHIQKLIKNIESLHPVEVAHEMIQATTQDSAQELVQE